MRTHNPITRSFLWFAILLAALGPVLSRAQVSVTTWHNDNWRTGQNTSETTITTGISDLNFGKLCTITLNLAQYGYEQVYAQPLVVWNGNGMMTVYIATMNDNVYAYHVPLTWSSCSGVASSVKTTSLLEPGEEPALCGNIGSTNCYTIGPTVGVLGTPVIDTQTNTLYVVAESQTKTSPYSFYHRIHALDATTLAEKFGGPATIPSLGVSGHPFLSYQLLQRPGLLMTYFGTVYPTLYIGFSMMDQGQPWPSGWVLAYDAWNLGNNQPLDYIATAPGSSAMGGGIWQGGAGLTFGMDETSTNYLYFSTANGDFDLNQQNSPGDMADSFVKLSLNLGTVAGYFTPSDQCYREGPGPDLDYGSAGVMLVPDNALPSPYAYMAIKSDKEDYLWAIDRGSPGGYTKGACKDQTDGYNCQNNGVPQCLPPWADQNLQYMQAHNNAGAKNSSAPAYWNGGLYFASRTDQMYLYPLSANCSPAPICAPTANSNVTNPEGDVLGYSPTPSVSSNGTSNGIVWVIRTDSREAGGNPAILYALNAINLHELYDSDQCKQSGNYVDQPGDGMKFSVPTVANGYVIIGTQTDIDIYGALTRTCN